MQRLQTRAQFQAVLAGSTVARTPHFALHRCALEEPARAGETAAPALFEPPAAWLGAMVPKRWAKRAVTRNAIKRQIYTVSAGFEAGMPQAAYVVRLRAGFDRKVFPSATSEALKAAVRAELHQLFERLLHPGHGAREERRP
jgi:ribonuclease P protein component